MKTLKDQRITDLQHACPQYTNSSVYNKQNEYQFILMTEI